MGYIAKPRLVAAVSEAGAMGLVPGSLGVDEVREDIRRTRDLTDRPFGVNLPLAFVKDPAIIDMVVEEGVRFVTTSAGSPTAHTPRLKEAGLTVFHVVPSLRGAQKATGRRLKRSGRAQGRVLGAGAAVEPVEVRRDPRRGRHRRVPGPLVGPVGQV